MVTAATKFWWILIVIAALAVIRRMAVNDPKLYECVGCETTDVCRPTELRSRDWEVHRLKDGTDVVLCGDCKITYSERRRIRKALAY